jgi:hypothetical protein
MARGAVRLFPLVLLLSLLAGLQPAATADVVSQDNSDVCRAVLPECEAKCRNQRSEMFFICSAGSGPMGGPNIVCRCAQAARPVGGNAQGAWLGGG